MPVSPPPLPDFTPVPVRPRADGWTPARQHDFLTALARSAHVGASCRAVGKTVASLYLLRNRPDAASFRAEWDTALAHAYQAGTVPLRDDALGPDTRRLRLLLRHRDPFADWL